MKKFFSAVMLLMLLLQCGCAAAPEAPEVTVPDMTVPETSSGTVPTETAATTEPELPEPEETEPLPEPQAQRITLGYRYMLEKEEMTWILSDNTWTTLGVLREDRVLTLSSQEPFGAIYLEWNTLPGEFALEWEGGDMVCGQEGFLHDYIRLPQAVTQIRFRMEPGREAELAELRLYTPGSAPDGVQDWAQPWEEADILVFATHSDDDIFFFGPMIAYYGIQRQLKIQVAFMVDHALAPIRCHERLNGLWALGVRSYPSIGPAPDGGEGSLEYGLKYYRDSDIYGWQMEQIRRFRPLVILGHDLEGEYGSFAHKVNAHYLTQTVLDAADPGKHPASAQRYGTWDTPKLYLHLYPENSWLFDGTQPMSADPLARSPIQVADDALDHHVSQGGEILSVWHQEGNPGWDCRPFGLYRTLVGYDSAADVMEHIEAETWR